MKKKYTGKLGQVLQAIHIVPLIIFAIVASILSYHSISNVMSREVRGQLQYAAETLQTLLDNYFPGDYRLEGETSYRIYKGETDITQSYELVDQFKRDTNFEVTLFYQDTRILTTLRDETGSRLIGSGAPDFIMKEVFYPGEAHFYKSALIYQRTYFSYYMPVYNSDGAVVGMIFIGKPTEEVDRAILESLNPLFFSILLTMIAVSVFLSLYTSRLVAVLYSIRKFLKDVSSGNLTAELDKKVSGRGDELGEIGRSAVTMQTSLRNMIEQDPLTELFNRRAANRKMKQIFQKYETNGTPFCITIGDIDFFKKVNDTYGHDCGDLILKNVSDMLRKHMRSYGFAARWGGEEFLMAFDHSDKAEARKVLEDLLDDIRAMESEYEGQIVKVTMTFGLAEGNTTDADKLIKDADERLYQGKLAGRNRIISDSDVYIIQDDDSLQYQKI